MDTQEPFSQLQLRFTDPIQYDYEAIRPVVLYAEAIAHRSREAEMPRSTLNEKARRFITGGMLGLVDQRTQIDKSRPNPYPEPVANHILYSSSCTHPFTTAKSCALSNANMAIKRPIPRLSSLARQTRGPRLTIIDIYSSNRHQGDSSHLWDLW